MRAFTLIEFLIVIGVLAIVLVVSVSAFSFLTKKSDLDSLRDNIVSALQLAKNKTLASEKANQYGIYFDISTDPDQYVIFQGDNYASRNISFDEINKFSKTTRISAVNFNGIGSEVVFNRLNGATNNYGSIVLASTKTNETRIIYVYPSGEISFQPESVSGTGRIIDSRHIHFNLGWNITGATILKFDFIQAGRTEQIAMADYFSVAEFDWEGEFLINNQIQKMRVHTHQLESTLLCVHRDRDEEQNNEEVYIYIVQDGIEKEIAHYDDDQNATVYKGTYVWGQMEQQ